MKHEIKGVKLTTEIDIVELLSELDIESKKILIEALSCQEDVVRHVTDQILDGYTENGWCSAFATSCNEIEFLPELQKSRVRISEALSELAYEQIRMLKIKNQNLAQELENARQVQCNYVGNH